MRRRDAMIAALVLAGLGACGGSEQTRDRCDAWKDAALRASLCSNVSVAPPDIDDECKSDATLAQDGPLDTLADCTSWLESHIHNCEGFDAAREAYEMDNDNIVFDYVKRTGKRPRCTCDALGDDARAAQCADPIARTNADD